MIGIPTDCPIPSLQRACILLPINTNMKSGWDLSNNITKEKRTEWQGGVGREGKCYFDRVLEEGMLEEVRSQRGPQRNQRRA